MGFIFYLLSSGVKPLPLNTGSTLHGLELLTPAFSPCRGQQEQGGHVCFSTHLHLTYYIYVLIVGGTCTCHRACVEVGGPLSETGLSFYSVGPAIKLKSSGLRTNLLVPAEPSLQPTSPF